ncbi:MAG: preprotein translocase subunit SecY [Planctomycetota bacterium]|nr:preprotein translocase subunit SecY [Planctomycetota bacterium]
MLAKLLTVFRVPELRRKIALTIVLLAVYRLGFHITLPFINHETVGKVVSNASAGRGGLGGLLQVMSVFSASDLQNGSVFGLGIMPYITASIVFQLLATVYPPLEQLQKEGESGRRRLNEYTRYATVVVCLVQSFFLLRTMSGGGSGQAVILPDYDGFHWLLFGTLVMTAGTVFLMWIGEQIDAYGIGNGISLLIMAGILARMPEIVLKWVKGAGKNMDIGTEFGIEKLIVMAIVFVTVIAIVVFITQGQRRIPIQSAKHVRGRRVMGGNRQWLPLRVNQSGVMPIIFSSSLLMIPFFVFSQLGQAFMGEDGSNKSWWAQGFSYLGESFSPGQGFTYSLGYIILIYFFCYFWTAITFNPKDMAENLKDNGSFIPGYRPGGRTAAHLEQVMLRITYVGAAFLAVVAVIPTIISNTITNDFVTASFFGGTGLLIIVSVALDLVQKIDSHLVMRNYPGLLDSDK